MANASAIRLRSDMLRKQHFSKDGTDLYSEKTTNAVYELLGTLAEEILKTNKTVIVDATFLKHWQRDRFVTLAKKLNVPFSVLAFEAKTEVLENRITLRQSLSQDASDASIAIMQQQLATLEPLSELEKKNTQYPQIEEVT